MSLSMFRILRFYILLCLLPYFVGSIVAEPKKGVMSEFRKQEEKIALRKKSPALVQRTLRRNIINAVQALVRRRLYEKRKDYYKDLSIANIAYENPTSHLVYYVKFKNFLARLEFELDPRLFIQQPKHTKFVPVQKD